MKWNIEDISKALATSPVHLGKGFYANGFSIDSRSIEKNDVFICIRGEKTDGHHYIQEAVKKGASGFILQEDFFQKNRELIPKNRTIFLAKDPLRSLQDLAMYYRKLLNAVVLGITGSNGKTSSKEMAASLLELIQGKDSVHSTLGNWNNHYGLPLSILKADHRVKYIVLELGMNHPGEIQTLSKIARPSHSLITCIAGAHSAFFHDIQEIALAKLEILEGMSKGGFLAYHAFSKGVKEALSLSQKAGVNLRLFGFSDNSRKSCLSILQEEKISSVRANDIFANSIFASNLQASLDGLHFLLETQNKTQKVHLPYFFHEAAASNLAGCLSLLSCAGIPIKLLLQACPEIRPQSKGRFQIIRKKRPHNEDQLLVDDSYNANPDSFCSALKALRKILPSGKLGVLAGEMAELGDASLHGHERVGEVAALLDYKLLGVSGDRFIEAMERSYKQEKKLREFIYAEDSLQLAEVLTAKSDLRSYDGLLVKGSRAAKMEFLREKIEGLNYLKA